MDAEKKMICVTVNGDSREVPEGLTIEELLDYFKVKKTTAVVEHNRTILPKDKIGAVFVSEGDCLEIVRFVGGG